MTLLIHTIYNFDSLNEFNDSTKALLSFTTLYTPTIDRWIIIKAVYQVEVECTVRVCLAAGLTVVHMTDTNSAIQHEVEYSDLVTHSREHVCKFLTT
jgi:hypothetical protein